MHPRETSSCSLRDGAAVCRRSGLARVTATQTSQLAT